MFNWLNKLFSASAKNNKYSAEIEEQKEWIKLFLDIEKNMYRSHSDPVVQKLADRWINLLTKFKSTDPTDNSQIHQVNVVKQDNLPDGIKQWSAEFNDPSAFIQKALEIRNENIQSK